MAQFLGMPYIELAKAAAIPALLYFLSVGMMVHFEALRMGLGTIPRHKLPHLMTTLREGGYLLLPIAVLIYLLVAGFTPYMSAFACIIATVVITSFADCILGLLRAKREGSGYGQSLRLTANMTARNTVNALENGGRGALAVAAACACTGIIIGVVTLTGAGLKLANGIVALSGGIFFLTLFLTMIASIILGMGLPTTAKYIILATIAAPAIQTFGVPALAAHLFIMYFGILADVTPPVALAAYAGAGIARANPNETGFTALKMAFAGFLIPFIFCYNPTLILINATALEICLATVTATAGILCLALAGVGHWLGAIPFWLRLLLLGAAVGLIDPGLITDIVGAVVLLLTWILQKAKYGKSPDPAAKT
jgi:TRAP transporter 4TM/12TM fusion protein